MTKKLIYMYYHKMTNFIKKYITQTNEFLKRVIIPALVRFMQKLKDIIVDYINKIKKLYFNSAIHLVLKNRRANLNKEIGSYINILSIIENDEIDEGFQRQFHDHLLQFINSVKPFPGKSIKILYKTKTDKIFHQYPSNKFSSVRIKKVTLTNIENTTSLYHISNADFKTDFAKEQAGVSFHFFNNYIYLIFGDKENRYFMQFLNRIDIIIRELKTKELYRSNLDRYKNDLIKVDKKLVKSERDLKEKEKLLKKRIYDTRNLLDVSKELHYLQEVDKVINSSLLIILGQFRFQKTFALLYDSEAMNYSRLFTKGFHLNKSEKVEINVDSPMIKFFSENISLSEISEIYQKVKFKKILKMLQKWQIDFIIPIIIDDRVKGIIGCGVKMFGRDIDKDETDMLNILVNIISISLGNAQLYEDVKKMSLTDAMTNLNNYRYFEDRLREEINRARRKKSCVSLLMLDIDYFKNYNDSLGHQAGDEALRLIGTVLKLTARDDDIVTRYGGEEFCVILPGVEKEVIRNLAERIRENVESFRFYKEDVQPEGKLTISVGGASFPGDADSFEDLVGKADTALYQSKHDGRNCFTLYSSTVG